MPGAKPEMIKFQTRLESLQNLSIGWLDGKGQPPSTEGIAWLLDCFRKYYPEDLPLPYAYPTEEGNVRFEWGRDGVNEASLDVDLQSKQAYWHELDLVQSVDQERELNLADEVDWHWLAERMKAWPGALE